jgi:hypothetical protein
MKQFYSDHVKENLITIGVVTGFFGLIAIISYFQWV